MVSHWILTLRISLITINILFLLFICHPRFSLSPPFILQCGSSTRDEGELFKTRERYCIHFPLGGYTFNSSGRQEHLEHNITTCLVHSFSPYLEQEAAKRFLDPPHHNIFYANSPAMVWHNDELLVVSRIWLDREVYESGLTKPWPENDFSDNWLYYQKFDKFLRPISEGTIMGIPIPKQFNVGDGPIEPRLFVHNDKVYATFNAAMSHKYDSFFDDTVMWDLEKNLPVLPKIQGGSPMLNTTSAIHRDKHWMPFEDHGKLYFVYNLDPFRILHCTVRGECQFHYQEMDQNGFIFDNSFSHLRGGTPFQLWRWPYYIGVAHTTLHKERTYHRMYTAHIVVLCVQPYKIVYVSNDLKIHPTLYLKAPMVRPQYIDDGFIFPVSLILESKDAAALGVHINDFSSVVLRIRGLRAVMESVIKSNEKSKEQRGPPAGYLQTHIHDVMENITGIRYEHADYQLQEAVSHVNSGPSISQSTSPGQGLA